MTAVDGVASVHRAIAGRGRRLHVRRHQWPPDRHDDRCPERHARAGGATGRDHPASADRDRRHPLRADCLRRGHLRECGDILLRQRYRRSLGQSGSTVALNGTLTTTASQGVATFTGLVLDAAGTGYNLQASGGGLTTTTNSFSVTPAAAVELAVTVPAPGDHDRRQPLRADCLVRGCLRQPGDKLQRQRDRRVSGGAPGGVTLSGTNAVTAVQGVAAFTGLAIDTVGTTTRSRSAAAP